MIQRRRRSSGNRSRDMTSGSTHSTEHSSDHVARSWTSGWMETWTRWAVPMGGLGNNSITPLGEVGRGLFRVSGVSGACCCGSLRTFRLMAFGRGWVARIANCSDGSVGSKPLDHEPEDGEQVAGGRLEAPADPACHLVPVCADVVGELLMGHAERFEQGAVVQGQSSSPLMNSLLFAPSFASPASRRMSSSAASFES